MSIIVIIIRSEINSNPYLSAKMIIKIGKNDSKIKIFINFHRTLPKKKKYDKYEKLNGLTINFSSPI